jgi:3-hydroxyacyl-[acyl-carrier-protein] dehydratase
MSLLRRHTEAALSDCRFSPDAADGTFHFGPDFIGFQGHFPGNPVLPAVCLIQAAATLLSRWTGHPLRVSEVVSAKFFASAGPGEHLRFACTLRPDGPDHPGVYAVTVRSERKIADLQLRLAPAQEGA